MDSEKIILFYRDDNLKKPILFRNEKSEKVAAAIPCEKKFLGRKRLIKKERIRKWITKLYEQTNATYFWLDDNLCDYLEMDKLDLPDCMIKDWLNRIPSFHTLIYADNKSGQVTNFVKERIDKVATICIVCYEDNYAEYENMESYFYEREGIVLQLFTYEELERHVTLFKRQVIVKGRCAVFDFDDRRSFWDKRLGSDIAYYSALNENRLFLDTFQKNRYNTLTK